MHTFFDVGADRLSLLPVAWLMFLLIPFGGFTFTDPQDFIFVTLIPVTIGLLRYRHVRTPYPIWWVRFASASSFLVAVVTPLVPLVALYILSSRAEMLIGHRPQTPIDDPKIICPGDSLYQRLYSSVVYASAFAGWGLFTWAALLIHLRRSICRLHLFLQIVVFLAAWVAFSCEPVQRFSWWLD